MKKIIFYSMTIGLTLMFNPGLLQASVSKPPSTVIVSDSINSLEAENLMTRLCEIENMDKSTLDFSEKKALRKEVRAIEKLLNKLGDSVIYISAGSAIIIVLLLIILF